MKTCSWSAISVEPKLTHCMDWMCRLAWLYTGGKRLITSVPAGKGFNILLKFHMFSSAEENDHFFIIFKNKIARC